jgi:hypothetical protein
VPTAKVDPTSAQPGDQLAVSGGGFSAGQSLQVTLCSDPVTLATITADSSGNYNQTVRIPSDTAAGVHTVMVSAPSGSPMATATITVNAATDTTTTTTAAPSGSSGGGGGGLAFTGAEIIRTILGGACLLLIGLLLVAAARRRHQ